MSMSAGRTGRLFRAAAVIARRDYVATVWSRSFVMFLLTPIIAIGFGGVINCFPNDSVNNNIPYRHSYLNVLIVKNDLT
jgi:hypothetical protein